MIIQNAGSLRALINLGLQSFFRLDKVLSQLALFCHALLLFRELEKLLFDPLLFCLAQLIICYAAWCAKIICLWIELRHDIRDGV